MPTLKVIFAIFGQAHILVLYNLGTNNKKKLKFVPPYAILVSRMLAEIQIIFVWP
jgi:hypothetical protein